MPKLKIFPPYPNRPMADADLVQLMLNRGLKADVDELSSAVSAIGYYRLKGYLVPFRKSGTEDFKDGTAFSVVWNIYNFDRGLRHLVMDALSRIEIALRVLSFNCQAAEQVARALSRAPSIRRCVCPERNGRTRLLATVSVLAVAFASDDKGDATFLSRRV